MLYVTLRALVDVGGSASIAELNPAVSTAARWSEQQQQVLHGDGPGTEIDYRLAWARTYLKMMGLVTNSARGVWAVTELGRATPEADLEVLRREASATRRAQRRTPAMAGAQDQVPGTVEEDETIGDPGEEAEQGGNAGDWRDVLLEQLLALAPDAFERLAQRLLREAGFLRATVTGRSGDGGIDGLGVYQISLLSLDPPPRLR